MGKRNVHVVHRASGDWAVTREGAKRASTVTSTQGQAEQVGRKLAQQDKVEILIHGRDNRIRDRDSYGNDPFPPRDKK